MYNTLYFHIRIQLCRFDYSHRPMQFLSMAQIEEFPHDRNVSMQSNCMSSYNITLFTIIFVSLWLSTLWNETFFQLYKMLEVYKVWQISRTAFKRQSVLAVWECGSLCKCFFILQDDSYAIIFFFIKDKVRFPLKNTTLKKHTHRLR